MNITSKEILDIIEKAGVTVNAAEIKCDQTFKQVGIDSLEQMNVFLAIEQTFDIKIEDEDVDKLTSVNAIVDYLNKN